MKNRQIKKGTPELRDLVMRLERTLKDYERKNGDFTIQLFTILEIKQIDVELKGNSAYVNNISVWNFTPTFLLEIIKAVETSIGVKNEIHYGTI